MNWIRTIGEKRSGNRHQYLVSASNIQTVEEIIFTVCYISCVILPSLFFVVGTNRFFPKSYYLYVYSERNSNHCQHRQITISTRRTRSRYLYTCTLFETWGSFYNRFTHYQFSPKSLLDILKRLIHYYTSHAWLEFNERKLIVCILHQWFRTLRRYVLLQYTR